MFLNIIIDNVNKLNCHLLDSILLPADLKNGTSKHVQLNTVLRNYEEIKSWKLTYTLYLE